MPDLPSVVAWRQFRKRAGRLLDAVDEHPAWELIRRQQMIPPETARRVRPLVPAPSAILQKYFEALLAKTPAPYSEAEAVLAPLRLTAVSDEARRARIIANSFCGWLSWRAEKRVYRLTPALASGLRRARWPDAYPVSHFHLPSSAIAVEVPDDPDNPALVGMTLLLYYDIQRSQFAAGATQVAICLVSEPGQPTAIGLPLLQALNVAYPSEGTLGEMRARLHEMLDERMPTPANDRGLAAWKLRLRMAVHLAVNTVLYLANDEDTVRASGHGPAPSRRPASRAGAPKVSTPTRASDLANPNLFDVGLRYAAAIERYARTLEPPVDGGPEATPTGRRVRPHMRAAHTHLYWTGPGRTVPRVRFLPPIPVGGGPDGERQTPIARSVR